jgi:hypothetical protein
MLIQRHDGPFSSVGAVLGGKPFETFGKDSEEKLRRREHGTTDRLVLPHQLE